MLRPIMARPHLPRLLTISLCAALGFACARSASAATWGSFNAARIAYAIGPLTGDNHAGLRALIEANGDTVASGTAELTAEYLAGVDVFYTAMLSDGTGPTAGEVGTLSPDEAQALQDWVAAGGTLIVTPDSNGFDGPWTPVYDSFTQVWGVAGYTFFPGEGTGVATAGHPITDNVTAYAFDGSTTFAFGIEGEALGGGLDDQNAFIAVFEPDTGFDVGGRLLLLGDHNMFTDPFLDSADNGTLAENVIAWAAGDAGGDTGSDTGGDTGDDTTGSGDATSGDSTGGTSSPADDTSGGPVPPLDDSTSTSGPGDGTTGGTGPGPDGTEGGTETAAAGDDEGGCACRASTRSAPSALWLVGLLALARRRRRP